MKYLVNEMFHTFQGEGNWIGVNAFFVRLHGCPVKCPWCDSAGTWHAKFKPDNVKRLTSDEIVHAAVESGTRIVVFTGGEPCMQDMTEVTHRLAEHKIDSHLETCGAFEIKGMFTYIMISPKWAALPLDENLHEADSLKIIVEDEMSIALWWKTLGPYFGNTTTWLHPEWSQRDNQKVLDKIIACVKNNAQLNLRAGWQLHKLYQADAKDPRSQPLVPLGGNPELGY